ncbi:unnamed protein product [Polarella glacialis]|uniref:Uncharacterized protein n=1 Tax=Polarella glacialis TaxID=89957 RepID=A0A813GAT8_POLGL|nr:unnamed protein product [Polarella glacialis]
MVVLVIDDVRFVQILAYGVQINEGHEVMVLGMRGFLFVELLAVLGNCGGVLFDELLAVLVTDGVLVVHLSGPWLRGHSVRFLFDELMAVRVIDGVLFVQSKRHMGNIFGLWTCVLTGPLYTEQEADVQVSLWRQTLTPRSQGHSVVSVSLDDLCGSRDSGDSFCTRVIALRVLLIMAEISSFCSAMYMLVGFFGTKHFREFALLKDGAHLAGVSFLLLLASTVLGETMSSIRLYPPNDAAATKVRPDGAGFLCAFIGLSVIMPAALSASLVECRSNALTASSTKSPRSQRAGSRPRNGNGRMVRAGSKAPTSSPLPTPREAMATSAPTLLGQGVAACIPPQSDKHHDMSF